MRVNAVNPGVILTELFTNGGVDNRDIERYLEQCQVLHPLGRAGRPEEVAATIGFLASGEIQIIRNFRLGFESL